HEPNQGQSLVSIEFLVARIGRGLIKGAQAWRPHCARETAVRGRSCGSWRLFFAPADDPVVGGGVVGNVCTGIPGHVALNAAVVFTLQAARRFGETARSPIVAIETTLAIVGYTFGGPDLPVRVMAGRAAKLAHTFCGPILAPSETRTQVHLLDVIHRFVWFIRLRLAHEDGPEVIEWHPRAEVVQVPTAPEDTHVPREMALLAHRRSQFRLQMTGIDNGVVGACRGILVAGVLDMRPTRTMAALATDRVPVEDRLRIAVDVAFQRSCPVGVTEEAVTTDRPARQ